MSEGISLSFFLASTVISTLILARKTKNKSTKRESARERRLSKLQTQFKDGQLLQQTLTHLGYKFLEGAHEQWWGENQDVEVTVLDREGTPWFALGRETERENYSILHLQGESSQDDFPPEERLSTRDPEEILGQLAQQYAFVKSLRTLLQDDYQIVDESQRSDQSRVVTLQKQDPSSGEQHQVRLVFKPSGNTSILTDARRPGGEHGTCPDMTDLLAAMGIAEYEKWLSPAAQRAQKRSKKKKQDSQQVQESQKQHLEQHEEI